MKTGEWQYSSSVMSNAVYEAEANSSVLFSAAERTPEGWFADDSAGVTKIGGSTDGILTITQ